MPPWSPNCLVPDSLVRPQRLGSPDGPTRGQAQGSGWCRTTPGFYVPSGTDRSAPEQRILEESVRLGPAGAVTGWASLRMHGAAYFDGVGDQPVPLVSPDRQLRRLPGSTVLRDPLDPEERVLIRGVPCTTVERALFDAVRKAPWWEGVVAVDMAAAAGLTSRRRMLLYVGGRPGWAGRERATDAVAAADDNSWSPRESDVRLVWSHLARLPAVICNRPVFSWDGRLLGVPDLLDVEAGLVVEYDGADHRGARPRQRDVARQEQFERHGLGMLVVVAPDLDDRARLSARVARRRAEQLERAAPVAYRRWTITPPPGWVSPRPPLDDRLLVRDLRRAERQ